MMNKNKVLLILALAMGFIASSMVYKTSGGPKESTLYATEIKRIPVVVAKVEIPAGVEILDTMVEVKEIDAEFKIDGAFSSIKAASGRYTRDKILPGEQVADKRVLEKGENYGLPITIPKGMRAVTIACNEVIGVAGFIKPGDFVDVLGTFDEQTLGKTGTLTVLENVQVLAISQEMKNEDDSSTAKLSTSATLAVTLQQAEKVTLGEEKGHLRLVLRPPGVDIEQRKGLTTPDKLVQSTGSAFNVAVREISGNNNIQKTSVKARAVPKKASTPETPWYSVEVIRGVEKETLRVPGQ